MVSPMLKWRIGSLAGFPIEIKSGFLLLLLVALFGGFGGGGLAALGFVAMFPNGMHTPLIVVVPLAAGLAGIFGVLLGAPTLRLRGDYLAIVTLLSFDGRYKIIRAIQEGVAFDERLQAARALIDECLRDWTAGARPEVVTLVNDAFRTDSQGEIRTARVLALRRLEITDERWQRAMQAIGEACQVVGSKSYIRVYERIGDTDQYRPISLDIAGV